MEVVDKTMKCYPVEPLLRAVVARTISGIEIMETARQQARLLLTSPVKERTSTVASTSSVTAGQHQVSDTEQGKLMEIMGHDNTAMQVARIFGEAHKVNINEILDDAGFQGLPHHLQGGAKVYQILAADVAAARLETPPRLSFCFVSLTCDEIFPGWISSEAVGGKANLQPEMLMGEDYVSKFGQALNKVGGKSRFFRKTGQWLLALLRWSTIAIATWQWSQVAMFTHVDTILHMVEKEVAKTGKLAASVAIFYCELLRRSWAERTRQGDITLVTLADLEHETSRIDEYILDIARTKIVQVLRQAGLSSHATPDTVGASTIGGELYLSSLNDKYGAALDSMTDRRQQQAAREIAKTEAEQARIAAALRKQETGDARTARERHTGKCIEKLEAKRKGKGKGKSEGKHYREPLPRGGGDYRRDRSRDRTTGGDRREYRDDRRR